MKDFPLAVDQSGLAAAAVEEGGQLPAVGTAEVVGTAIPADIGFLEAGKEPVQIREHKAGPFRSGTGDVFSSILAADAVKGVCLTDSVRHASAFIAKALRRTMELDMPKTDGICFEEFLKEI